jgi:hypothetical protein
MARGSVSTTKVLIPSLQKVGTPILHDVFNLAQLVCGESLRIGEFNRLKPEFGQLAFPTHMHVSWLAALVAVEEKAVRPHVPEIRHDADSPTKCAE